MSVLGREEVEASKPSHCSVDLQVPESKVLAAISPICWEQASFGDQTS